MKKIVTSPGFGEIIEKKSRFIGEIHPVSSAEEAKELVAGVKKKYYDARHHCYAYLLGAEGDTKKYSDDGEPQGTAGLPMLSVLEGNDLTDCLVVVTRYFGGTLLGTGGLVRAYTEAAQAALADATFAEKIESVRMSFGLDYKNEGTVRRIIENTAGRGVCVVIEGVDYSDKCHITVNVESGEADALERNVVEALSGQVEAERVENTFLLA